MLLQVLGLKQQRDSNITFLQLLSVWKDDMEHTGVTSFLGGNVLCKVCHCGISKYPRGWLTQMFGFYSFSTRGFLDRIHSPWNIWHIKERGSQSWRGGSMIRECTVLLDDQTLISSMSGGSQLHKFHLQGIWSLWLLWTPELVCTYPYTQLKITQINLLKEW